MKRMVTRTVKAHTYTVMALDVTTAEVQNIDYTIGGEYSDNDALKLLKKSHETDAFKLVAIVAHTFKEILYGMDESDFIAHAQILPPRKTADK